MGFMGAAVGIGHAVGELMDGEHAIGFEDAAFAVVPWTRVASMALRQGLSIGREPVMTRRPWPSRLTRRL
jgi:hypothetical protein